ncbi:MAG: IMP dehydrogenase [Candidatus Woesearchaeota archaeon]
MVKRIIWEPGRTFSEFSLLTGYTGKDCKITDVDLTTRLSVNLTLKYPLMSAAMTSVTGYEMCVALGKFGGIGILPVNLPIEEQAQIVKSIKHLDLSFVEDPLTARENETIEEVIRKIEQHGHSTIPVVDRFQNFLGMFVQQRYWESGITPVKKVTEAMIPYSESASQIDVCHDPLISVDDVKEMLTHIKGKYVVILDEQQRLVKIAFKQDIDDIKVGSAISSHEGWENRVEANISAGVDLLCLDTSDAFGFFPENLIRSYKANKYDIPLCAGNVITYDGAMCLMNVGADMIKVGMSSGSICTTQREKATGRAPMTALLDVVQARNDYYSKTGRYVPIIADGGIATSADMIIALSVADAIMLGGYLNHFFEAAAPKLDKKGNITTDESKMEYVETWGEGSERARNLGRYGHAVRKTFFAEGAEGTIPYRRRLKPWLEKDMTKIEAALSNAGCRNLYEFRDNAVLELNSPHTSMVVSTTHDMQEKK